MKKWYTSKTLWVNSIALGYAIYAAVQGGETPPAIDPQTQLAILAGVNWVLRLITKTAVNWD